MTNKEAMIEKIRTARNLLISAVDSVNDPELDRHFLTVDEALRQMNNHITLNYPDKPANYDEVC